ncbi:MFS transporter [Bacillus sp. 1P06AnD]|uniref:MFS transporter n=1 Tax=Bacillus sp. 1P06AnD TaxID=3132208 RepID=UPI0039A28B13
MDGRLSSHIQEYVDSPEKQVQLYRRTLIIVVISQMFGGAGLAAGITVGALIAQDMLGTSSFAGVPTALFTLGSALAAFLVGWLSQRFGRRFGLSTGFIAGGIGAIGVVAAAKTDSIALLFFSLFIYGAGTATNLQARYAGTDMANSAQRATAVSIAMVSTTLGAVAGPNLVDVMGGFATSVGVPPLSDPFLLAAAAYILAGLILMILLRPDPFIVAKAIVDSKARSLQSEHSSDKEGNEKNKRGIMVGAAVMILTQMIMVAIMTMTPVHMKHHGQEMAQVGIVIGIHVGAMYLPSLVTGYLVDKMGRTFMAVASGATLLSAGLVAALVPADSMPGLILALALLGIGWNFGLISGTALIIDAASPDTRAKTQGTVDVLIALAGASGGALSGFIVAQSSYAALAFIGAILSLAMIPIVVWVRITSQSERSL